MGWPGDSLRERAAYAFFGAAIFLFPFAKIGAIKIGGPALQICDVFFLVSFVLWLSTRNTSHVKSVYQKKLYWVLIAYVVVVVASAFASPMPYRSVLRVAGLCLLIAWMIVAQSFTQTPVSLRFALRIWTASAFLTAVFGLIAVLLFYLGIRDRNVNFLLWNYGSLPSGNYPRINVFFRNSNMLCNYLIMSVGLAVALFYLESNPRLKRMIVVAVTCMLAAAVFTLSTGLGGFAILVAILFVATVRIRRPAQKVYTSLVLVAGFGMAALLGAASVVPLVPKGQGDFSLGVVDVKIAKSARVYIWQTALETFSEHPWLGKGYGTRVSHTLAPKSLHRMEYWGTSYGAQKEYAELEAHNIWLNILGQVGFIGFLTFSLFVLLLCSEMCVVPIKIPFMWFRFSLLGIWGGAVFYHGIFSALEDARHFWVLFGLTAAFRDVTFEAATS